MSGSILSLAKYQTEEHKLEIAPDEFVSFIVRSDMSLEQSAQVRKYMQMVGTAQRRFKKAKTDSARKKAIESERNTLRRMLVVIVPDVPEAFVNDLTVTQLGIITNHWLDLGQEDDEDVLDEGNE